MGMVWIAFPLSKQTMLSVDFLEPHTKHMSELRNSKESQNNKPQNTLPNQLKTKAGPAEETS